MLTSYSDDLNQELLKDFFYDLNDAYQRCEKILIALELTPDDQPLITDLFRSVHTIKANLVYVGLREFCPLLQGVEDVLEELRSGRMAYNDLISDMVLLAIEATRKMVDGSVTPRQSSISKNAFAAGCAAIGQVVSAPAAQRRQAIYNAILILDPDTKALRPDKQTLQPGNKAPRPDNKTPRPDNQMPRPAGQAPQARLSGHGAEAPANDQGLAEFGVEALPDLDFFAQLALAFERRSKYWHESNRRIARLALAMNDAAGRPVNASQLAAAVYVHDFGMAFLPLELLHKQTTYDHHEQLQLHHHVKIGYELLRHMKNWQPAGEIVSQHHEHCDGNGYPEGLTEESICDGAKIIAIADAFEACSHSRAHNLELKRPLIRAVLEINRHAGSQFSQFWVDIFNKVARPGIDCSGNRGY